MGQGAQSLLLWSSTPSCGKEAFLFPTDLPQGWYGVLQKDQFTAAGDEAAPAVIPTGVNPLPHNPAGRLQLLWTQLSAPSCCDQGLPWNTVSHLLCRTSAWGSTWSQVMTSWAMLTTAQELLSNSIRRWMVDFLYLFKEREHSHRLSKVFRQLSPRTGTNGIYPRTLEQKTGMNQFASSTLDPPHPTAAAWTSALPVFQVPVKGNSHTQRWEHPFLILLLLLLTHLLHVRRKNNHECLLFAKC